MPLVTRPRFAIRCQYRELCLPFIERRAFSLNLPAKLPKVEERLVSWI